MDDIKEKGNGCFFKLSENQYEKLGGTAVVAKMIELLESLGAYDVKSSDYFVGGFSFHASSCEKVEAIIKEVENFINN